MTSKIKFTKQHPRDLDIQGMQREIEDKVVALDKDGNVILDRDIRCRSIYVEGDSVYIAGVRMVSPIHSDKNGYWKYNRELKEFDFTTETRPEDHAERHEVGGDDLVNHDDLTGFVADEHIPLASVTVNIPISFDIYDAEPSRASENNVHGGLLSLAVGQPLDTVPTNIPISKGTGKIMIVVNAGSDISGTISIAGDSVDRDTGVTGADTEELAVDALTTDGSDTDSNGNDRHAFTGAYISSKWWTGAITISTSDLTLTDVDVYHVSFEQFGDLSGITLDTFDANIFTTNVAAEFDAYLYSIEVTGAKCNVIRQASLNVGADGETAIANKYWRLRKGSIAKALDGSTDGVWVDIHYSNSPAYVEDVTVKVWATKSQSLTY